MLYYRVKKAYDQKHKNPKVRDGNILVADELYTPSEVRKLVHLNIDQVFDKVEVPKTRTYWFFGARFECKA